MKYSSSSTSLFLNWSIIILILKSHTHTHTYIHSCKLVWFLSLSLRLVRILAEKKVKLKERPNKTNFSSSSSVLLLLNNERWKAIWLFRDLCSLFFSPPSLFLIGNDDDDDDDAYFNGPRLFCALFKVQHTHTHTYSFRTKYDGEAWRRQKKRDARTQRTMICLCFFTSEFLIEA